VRPLTPLGRCRSYRGGCQASQGIVVDGFRQRRKAAIPHDLRVVISSKPCWPVKLACVVVAGRCWSRMSWFGSLRVTIADLVRLPVSWLPGHALGGSLAISQNRLEQDSLVSLTLLWCSSDHLAPLLYGRFAGRQTFRLGWDSVVWPAALLILIPPVLTTRGRGRQVNSLLCPPEQAADRKQTSLLYAVP